MKTLTNLIALSTLTLLGTAAHAASASDSEVRSATVRFADLNVASPQGAALLYSRIRAAAQDVCGEFEAERSLALMQKQRQCMQTAIGSAVNQVAAPGLTDYAAARDPGHPGATASNH